MDEKELTKRHLRTLQAFVLRARRISEHSLAKNRELLAKYENPQMKVTFTPSTGATKIGFELPNEEQFESAAARVRPLILVSEPTHHSKVMGALLYFAQKGNVAEQGIAALRDWKKQWAQMNPDGNGLSHYDVRQQEKDFEEARLTDRQLAFAWIYGDVVHADADRREESQRFGVEERFRAALPVIVRLIILTIHTLNVIKVLNGRGELPDLGDVFEEEVVVTRTLIETDATIWVADRPDDAPPPDPGPMNAAPGPEWQSFTDAIGGLITPHPEMESDSMPESDDPHG